MGMSTQLGLNSREKPLFKREKNLRKIKGQNVYSLTDKWLATEKYCQVNRCFFAYTGGSVGDGRVLLLGDDLGVN
mgnify:CR=1 FL=1